MSIIIPVVLAHSRVCIPDVDHAGSQHCFHAALNPTEQCGGNFMKWQAALEGPPEHSMFWESGMTYDNRTSKSMGCLTKRPASSLLAVRLLPLFEEMAPLCRGDRLSPSEKH